MAQVQLDVPHNEGPRNRGTVAIRIILAIPHLVLVGAPGAGSGANFIGFQGVSINNAGQVAVQAKLLGTGVDASTWDGAPSIRSE